MKFKLGFGPMSIRIVDILAKYSKEKQRPLMIIASRNQVDSASGYVMNTRSLSEQVQKYRTSKLLLCRDHCGPYFLDSEKNLGLRDAVEATKTTIAADIENGFDLIHIDTSRCPDPYQVADELFEFCLSLNPQIKFEFGTEENVGVTAALQKYRNDVDFVSDYPNMEFVVAQTGSLTMEDRQVGNFNLSDVADLVRYADTLGIGLKEHNADYLTPEQIQLRRQVGVHACNIAPELGVLQTRCILSLADHFEVPSGDFKQVILDSGKWQKWLLTGDDNVKVNIAGHYCFNSAEYKELEDRLGKVCNVDLAVENAIVSCLDRYYTNLY